MRHRILHLTLTCHIICAQLDPVFRIKPTLHPDIASSTAHIVWAQVAAEIRDLGRHVADYGGVLEKPVTLRFAAAAVDGFVAEVGVVPVLFLS